MAPSAMFEGIPHGTGPESKSESHILEFLSSLSGQNFKTLRDVSLTGLHGEPIDDKTYLMERVIQLTAGLPPGDRLSDTLTNSFLHQLWEDLEHPPTSYLGYDFAFRKADGSNNNVLWPHIGKAGMPYARSVRPRKLQPPRPDPGVVFDSVLKREGFTPHPNKISSVLFYTASIIIHDCFHTSHDDYAISETSSYLDLAPLYGSNEEQQKTVRTFKDGRLREDCFADARIHGFPPGVGVMLIMFNRFHNIVVENLAKIDEGQRFSNIKSPIEAYRRQTGLTDTKVKRTPDEAYDEALFQTGRLVTTGLYVNIVLQDYVRTILGLNKVDTLWNLDPRSDYGNALFAKKIPQAQGNQVSAEFSLVYRWHSCVSQRDEAWTNELFEQMNLKPDTDARTLMREAGIWADKLKKTLPHERPFEKLQRDENGRFSDDELCKIWCDSVDDVAGAFGAAHVPSNLKFVEVLSMIQARRWNLASLNEFREYFKLKPHETFESINPDPHIAKQLERLYGHPDNVEMYPGIVVESAKQPMAPGSGLCASWTTSRAILGDAVSLIRSDRFHTVDYTPKNLTNWGFQASSYDQDINHGGVFYKLVLSAFPNNVAKNSVYAHFPLVNPPENKKILKEMARDQYYNFTRPVARPAPQITQASAQLGSQALTDSSSFASLWPQRSAVFGAPETIKKTSELKMSFAEAVLSNDKLKSVTESFYNTALEKLWREKQYQLGQSKTIDIVADVLNAAHASYVATVLGIPLSEQGSHDEPAGLLGIFSHIHDSAHGVHPHPQGLSGSVRDSVHSVVDWIGSMFGSASKVGELGKAALAKIRDVNGISAEEAAWSDVLPTAALILTTLCRSSALAVQKALPQPPKPGAPANIPTGDTKTSDVTIAKRVVTSTSDVQKDQVVAVKVSASAGPEDVSALGSEVVLTQKVATIANKVILDIIGKHPGIKPVPGRQGELGRVDIGGETKYLNHTESDYVAYPVSMKVTWEVKK